MPLVILPWWAYMKNIKVKNALFLLSVIALVCTLYVMQPYIQGIAAGFSDDAAVAEGRSSAPAALAKILLGPTPFHYFFSEQFLLQPFAYEQSIMFGLLNFLFYIVLAFWLVYLLYNYKAVIKILSENLAKMFVFAVAFSQCLVYVIIYGSADIRQRAIIVSLAFISTISDKSIFRLRDTMRSKFLMSSIIGCLAIITLINS